MIAGVPEAMCIGTVGSSVVTQECSDMLRNSHQRFFIAIAGFIALASVSASAAVQKIYWTDFWNVPPILESSNPNGSGRQTVRTNFSLPLGITIDEQADHIYLADGNARTIFRMDLDGSNLTSLISRPYPSQVYDVALDKVHGKMYYVDAYTNEVFRANLNGSGVELLVSGQEQPRAIVLDVASGKMYWSNANTGIVRRANLDGSGIEVVFDSTGSIEGLELDLSAGKMYIADYGNDKIFRANLDGTVIETILDGSDGINSPRQLALDTVAQQLYWTDSGLDQIYRANFDGTGKTTIIASGLDAPLGIALLFIPEPMSGAMALLAAVALSGRRFGKTSRR
jgi:DNA-binding beta-propeller fold protein YncE